MTALGTTGMPLGMLDIAEFGMDRTHLRPGDKIFAYSDGLTEAEDVNGTFFGSPQLKSFLREHANEPAPQLHNELMSEVHRFTGRAVQSDDVTALVLEYAP